MLNLAKRLVIGVYRRLQYNHVNHHVLYSPAVTIIKNSKKIDRIIKIIESYPNKRKHELLSISLLHAKLLKEPTLKAARYANRLNKTLYLSGRDMYPAHVILSYYGIEHVYDPILNRQTAEYYHDIHVPNEPIIFFDTGFIGSIFTHLTRRKVIHQDSIIFLLSCEDDDKETIISTLSRSQVLDIEYTVPKAFDARMNLHEFHIKHRTNILEYTYQLIETLRGLI